MKRAVCASLGALVLAYASAATVHAAAPAAVPTFTKDVAPIMFEKCATCHRVMDPPGFALENFDALGRWRDVDAESNEPIDASGTMPDGTAFNGPVEFRNALMKRRGEFIATVVEKLLTYALGRGVEYYDRPAIRQVVRSSARNDYRWSSIILGIVQSRPFQMRIAAVDDVPLQAGHTAQPVGRQ